MGHVLKHAASSELLTAIHAALKGRIYVTSKITKGILQAYITSSHQVITRWRDSNGSTPLDRPGADMGELFTPLLIILELARTHSDDFAHLFGSCVELGQPQQPSQQGR